MFLQPISFPRFKIHVLFLPSFCVRLRLLGAITNSKLLGDVRRKFDDRFPIKEYTIGALTKHECLEKRLHCHDRFVNVSILDFSSFDQYIPLCSPCPSLIIAPLLEFKVTMPLKP